jgi:ceramide glucosyltransferase
MTLAPFVFSGLGWTFVALSQLGVIYTLVAALTVRGTFRRGRRPAEGPTPDVTIVKPLNGADTGLRGTLAAFCRQDYPGRIQIVFGVHDDADPAIEIVRDLQLEYPGMDIDLVIDPRMHGANRKATNLINMADSARHGVLILSDADIIVDRDYVRTVTTALSEPGVGLVSCLYLGKARGGLWARLSAMAINYRFIPSAILGKALGLAEPCFGATIGVRAEVLERIGGFTAFADHLADDYEIGRAVRDLGLKISMPPMFVTHICDEHSAREMIVRELRWGRTVRQIDPVGYAGSLVTYPFPLILIAAAFLGPTPIVLGLVVSTLAVRIVFRLVIDAITGASEGRWWLIPVGDILSFGLFVASFGVNRVGWHGTRFRVSREGALLHS